jgi:hypothetical protein
VLYLIPLKALAIFVVFAANPHGLNLELVIPLALSCLSYTCARISGVHSNVGRPTGVFFSILCFLFLSAALGSVLALFFYKDPPGI